jgi:hypothetical protein
MNVVTSHFQLFEDIDERGNRSHQFNYLIDFSLYYAGKRAIVEVRQIFLFLPISVMCNKGIKSMDYE